MEGFEDLLTGMSKRPQDYITPRGRMTTNTVEAFHSLALLYGGKRTDLEHVHYTCKTNMAICHKVRYIYNMLDVVHMFPPSLLHTSFQNIGPIWKIVCCMKMGVPVPLHAAQSRES